MTLTSKEAQSQSLPRGLHATAKLALRIPRVIQRPQPRPSLVFSRSAAARDCNVVCRRNRPLGAQLSRLTLLDHQPHTATCHRTRSSSHSRNLLIHHFLLSPESFSITAVHHTGRSASPLHFYRTNPATCHCVSFLLAPILSKPPLHPLLIILAGIMCP